jgi:hypothetical protein
MNDKLTGGRARWRGWPQGAAILIVMVSIALLTAACGGSGASAGSGASPSATSTYAKLVAWAQCMRSHGVPNFPDPSSNGAFNANSLNLQSPQMQSAQNACKSLQPTNLGTSGQSHAQDLTQKLKFAQCMRTHGVPNFPDPSSDGAFHISIKSINTQSATYKKAQQACQSIMSSGPGQQTGGGS